MLQYAWPQARMETGLSSAPVNRAKQVKVILRPVVIDPNSTHLATTRLPSLSVPRRTVPRSFSSSCGPSLKSCGRACH